MQREHEGFFNLAGLTRAVGMIVAVQVTLIAMASITNGFKCIALRDLVREGGGSLEAAAAIYWGGQFELILDLSQVAVFLVSAVLVLKWIHRANLGARSLGALGMRYTPGWSVGWYFVPIASLWKPYQAMCELWKTSATSVGWSYQSVSPLVAWWWGLYLTMGLLNYGVMRLMLNATSIEDFAFLCKLETGAGILDISLNLITAILIARIFRMQNARAGLTMDREDPPASAS
ncbi:DUF4328 domain-containing protein [Chitiniphilus shinanonensis]|uniref:DUF4328 domain-containing protein n=1 Tax=Chitiniphilus shinanonensis TaxID=553088 RepID=UPI00305FAA18